MISSVRQGLDDARDAAAPLIAALGHEPVRFEDEPAQSVPSRAVCVDLVRSSDIYLLLLGEHYGEPLPDTGLAPTAEEWQVARTLGKPIVVFRRRGGTPEPRQQDFIAEVEAYAYGVFRDSFDSVPELLGKLKPALEAARSLLQPLIPQALADPVIVPWREAGSSFLSTTGVVLDTHVVPIGPTSRLRAIDLEPLAGRLARSAREHGLISESEPLERSIDEGAVAVALGRQAAHDERGLRVTVDRTVTVWRQLPSEHGATDYDEGVFRSMIADDLRLVASLDLIASDTVAVGIALSRIESLAERTSPTSWTYPFMGRASGPLHLEPDSAIATSSLARAAAGIAEEIVARLRLRLRTPSKTG